jgi:hypothetical protein
MKILPKEIIDNVSIKNVKTDFGHDLGGFFCDIYFKKKKVGYLNNDGWGGCPDVRPYGYDEKDKVLMKSFEDFLTEQNFAQFQADEYNKPHPQMVNSENDWKATDFTFEQQVEFLCERLLYLKEIDSKQKKAILIGNPRGGSFKMLSFKLALNVIKEKHSGALKAKILEIQSKLEKDECILNTNLEEFLK